LNLKSRNNPNKILNSASNLKLKQ